MFRFDLVVGNSGAGPALGIALEAVASNAKDDQAADLLAFFERPAASEAGIAELVPFGGTTLGHEVRMPRAALRAYGAQGRALVVPVIAFCATYRTAGREGRTGAAFLIGHEAPNSDRLAPLVLPEGEGRLFGLGVRRLDEAVRR